MLQHVYKIRFDVAFYRAAFILSNISDRISKKKKKKKKKKKAVECVMECGMVHIKKPLLQIGNSPYIVPCVTISVVL